MRTFEQGSVETMALLEKILNVRTLTVFSLRLLLLLLLLVPMDIVLGRGVKNIEVAIACITDF